MYRSDTDSIYLDLSDLVKSVPSMGDIPRESGRCSE